MAGRLLDPGPDLTPADTVRLAVIALLFFGSMVWSSFYNDDSPIQFRVQNCHVAHPTARECPVSLVWAER